MSIEHSHLSEAKNKLPDIPQSREIYSGDINAAVITVQKVTGFEITPEWWFKHVGNDGSTEEILKRFDTAFGKFVRKEMTGISEEEQDVAESASEAEILDEADKQLKEFDDWFNGDPDYDDEREEFIGALHRHLEQKYFSGDAFEMNDKEAFQERFGIGVDIAKEYSPEENEQFQALVEKSLAAIDELSDGKTKSLFQGLTIKVGEGLTSSGGGEAISDENVVVLNGRAMLMSLAEMREPAGYDLDELTGGSIDEHEPGSALQYVLVHEMGHILDERTLSGDQKHRVSAAESPTKYGREPDEWHDEKDHEAFAEGFAHMVYDMPVTDALAKAVRDTIELRFLELTNT